MASRKYTSLPYIEKPVAPGNFGPSGRTPIKTIVWHTTDGTLPGTLAWFNNKASQVSSNYIIDLSGTLYAMLEEFYVPYTNGNLASNRQSVTIEVIDNNNPNGPRPDVVYKTAAKLCRDLCQFYGLAINRTTNLRHNEIPPYSHPQCPGSLDVDRIVREAMPPIPDHDYKAAIDDIRPFVFGAGPLDVRMNSIADMYRKHGL